MLNINTHSEYARVFDRGCHGWTDDKEHNLIFLSSFQHHFNYKLITQGYLLLSEVYEQLGFEVDERSKVVGWIYDEKNPIGDNFVDFDLYTIYNRDKNNDKIVLDFNVDGNIIDLIPKYKK